jgi:hypothetical protein
MGDEAQSSVVMDGWVIVLTVTVLLWSIGGLGAKVRNGAKNSRRDRVDLGSKGIQILCSFQHLTPTYECQKISPTN